MKRACVIGWPVEHSRSPVIHRYWLKLYGLDGAYEKEAVRPEEIDGFLRSLGKRGYVGANVTLPHKEAALAAADRPDEAATRDRRGEHAVARRQGRCCTRATPTPMAS